MSSDSAPGRQSPWRKAALLIYPFLLAGYPVIALRAHNITYVDLPSILRSLLLVIAGTALVYPLTWLLVGSLEKASVITSLIAIWFLAYGHLYLKIADALGDLPRHSVLHRLAAGLVVGHPPGIEVRRACPGAGAVPLR